MTAVIADDITGAAEMAGIARRLGLSVRMVTEPTHTSGCDVLVVATDTRSMTAAEAAEECRRVASALEAAEGVSEIFKKTDSALRGHVVDEISAILSATHYEDALYLPANPSKGRTIRNGVYYIGEKPIHETDFSFDPEFPAFSSSLPERLPGCAEARIVCPDAAVTDDVRRAVASAGNKTLLAGAADLFTEYLLDRYDCTPHGSHVAAVNLRDCLIVCGSTQSRPVDCGCEISYMPTDVYNGDSAAAVRWVVECSTRFGRHHAMTLAIRDRHRTGRDTAMYLRSVIADVVSAVIDIHMPRDLVIEGGATAYAILRRLGWNSFIISAEIAPGVIRMKAPCGTSVTMKPGSYLWGDMFADQYAVKNNASPFDR